MSTRARSSGKAAERDAPRPTEVELKFRASDRDAAERLLSATMLGPLKARGDVTETHHNDHYFDTASGALRKAGYAARIRETPDGSLLSLKSRVPSSTALHRREELEAPATTDLQPRSWPESVARSALLGLSGDDRLVETVRIDQTRRRRVFGHDGTSVELSLDDVRVVEGNDEVDRFVELEAELTAGSEDDLQQVEEAVTRIPGLDPAPSSKLEAAERAVQQAAERRQHARRTRRKPEQKSSPGVEAQDTLASAARKVVRFHLSRMVKRSDGARSGRNPEDLHAMRVATRRQRAALRLFEDALPARDARKLRRGLRTVAASLGRVRDLDVLIEAAEQYAAALPKSRSRAFEPLLDAWRARRDDAREEMARRLDSKRYERLVEHAEAFSDRADDPWSVAWGLHEPHLVRDTAPARIWAAYHVVHAYEPVLDWADVATLHALRIAAKRLRYTLEFFGETLGSEAGELVARIVALQDHLGELHDADVAARLAREFLAKHGVSLTAAQRAEIGGYLVDRETEVTRLRRSLGAPWRAISGVRFRRALGRAVARL
jgi:CHAD domain-containing protein/adenylate cyclase class IV